jgi:hypothetical protein
MVATRAQRSAAAAAPPASVRRALQSEDVLACVLAQLDVRDGCLCSVASISKAWRAAWRRRCAGRCRLLRTQIGAFEYAVHVTALPGGGAIVPDYGHFRLEAFSRDGDAQAIYCERFDTPGAIALLGDGTAWVLARDGNALCRVRWQDEIGAEPPSERWPNEAHHEEDENFGDPYRRILRHVDIRALGWSMDCSLLPYDLAVSGDRLILLCQGGGSWGIARICVFDSQTGAFLYHIVAELKGPMSLAVHQDLCFVADTYNHVIKIFNFRQRTLVRTIGGTAESDLPCEFTMPSGVAFQGGRLYVSEAKGRRIQILRFVDGIHGAVECLQIIQSPNGKHLYGLCVSGERLWCVGSTVSDVPTAYWKGCLHLFTACV